MKRWKSGWRASGSSRSSAAQSAGESVSATNPEMATDTAIVTANCRYISPTSPPRKATGRNTAVRTKTIAITGPVTCSIALIVASRGDRRSSAMIRSTFSSTTIASSTTMPIASTMPNKVSVLMEKPNSSIALNVPISDTGTASIGIMVARQFCRNRKTTAKTSAMDSPSVFSTSTIDTRTNLVVS